MSWLGFVLVILGIYVAFKVAGLVLRLVVTALIVIAAYWWLAPLLGWPSLGELFYVLGPDIQVPEISLPDIGLP
ncbi:hypothetical protein LDO26_10505 [Luteimonas sp. BDR2-5]|uniref:hypothetical protein n=1 Tax=Proluteimonas luteida TaxID=2878685 RepID=UPI001E57B32B|nr:hypothetical protein [Luteimonas sp. BDR2-5]MCD9028635.1 hypothetical protein [Luteimonas sp. BDR2-5]